MLGKILILLGGSFMRKTFEAVGTKGHLVPHGMLITEGTALADFR